MGGLARRATLIQQVRDENSGPLLVVDAGNSLMGETLSLNSEGRVILEAMNLMGYDALGVGTGELLKGPEVLQQRIAEAQFPVLSSNLVHSDSGAPVLEPYVVIERGSVRFGVIGVSSPTVLEGLESLWPGVTVVAPEDVLAAAIAQLSGQADLIVVLSQLGLEADLALAGAVEGIDVIVGGGSRYVLTEAQAVKSTTVVQAGYDGEWVGRLDLQGPQGDLAMSSYQILYMRPDVADDPGMKELVTRYYREYP
jgi:5'-nucleotidase/UDP-sugar diphosphatase